MPIDLGQSVRVGLPVGEVPSDGLPIRGLVQKNLGEGERVEDVVAWIGGGSELECLRR